MNRRELIKAAAAALPWMALGADAKPRTGPLARKPDHLIQIGTSLIDLDDRTTVSTRTYNGQFPGPLIRMTEGKPVTIEIRNNTDSAEQVHWHGQHLSAEVDGAGEEGTPPIAPHGRRVLSFEPRPAGFRFFHTHTTAGVDLSLGLYSGQAGLIFIEPRREPGKYDKEVFLTLKEFGPYLNHFEMPGSFLAHKIADPRLQAIDKLAVAAAIRNRRQPLGYELAYSFYTINGRTLNGGEPIKVKQGQRVMFHIVNASATEIRSLMLPGHTFKVVALDGNPVPRVRDVPVLWLGPAERVSAVVEMKAPGVWILGDVDPMTRSQGMGIVVEYANHTGDAQWGKVPAFFWDYSLFANPAQRSRKPDKTLELVFATRYAARSGFNEFTINGQAFSMSRMQPMFPIAFGKRYRLRMRNATDDVHPIHLHRHSFEITSITGVPTAGVIKDVAMIGGFQEMTIDFDANQKGLSLFHCHMQNHMDFGFMALFNCT